MIQLFERLNDMSCINSRFIEKGNLEIMLFTLQSKMRANNQRAYLPAEGKLISDINKAWDRLEKAEHERELSLREELIRYRISTENSAWFTIFMLCLWLVERYMQVDTFVYPCTVMLRLRFCGSEFEVTLFYWTISSEHISQQP